MEKIYGKYLVNVPTSTNMLELSVNTRVLVKFEGTYKQLLINGFLFYDGVIFVNLIDSTGENVITRKPKDIIGKIIKTIIWEEDYIEFLEKAPFDLASLETDKLIDPITYLYGSVKVRLYPKDKMEDIALIPNEVYRGTFVPMGTDNEIDFVLITK